MATSFTLFPDLPAELRRKIWAEAVNHPRLIYPQQAPLDTPSPRTGDRWLEDPQLDFLPLSPKPYFHCAPPVLLQICRESRDEALSHYYHVFLPGGSSLGPPLYLNPSVDILYFSHAFSAAARTSLDYSFLGEEFSFFKRSVLGRDGIFKRTYPASRPPTPWDDLRAIGLCSMEAARIELLCLRFPKLERIYLVQTWNNMADAHLWKTSQERSLERRREARGDGGIPEGLVLTLITWEGLRKAGGEWDVVVETESEGSVTQCQTCFVDDGMHGASFGK